MAKTLYDIIIVGGGAAGLTAAIYTCRKKLKTLVLSVDIGGQTNLTNHIENYPGFSKETEGYPAGPRLMQIFEEQAKTFGAEFVFGKIEKIKKTAKGFSLKLSNEEVYESKALILAYGKVARELGVPGEKKFIGRGVSTCATCDAPIFKNKTVAVVGGGNSAIEAVELLEKFAPKVYLIHRREQFRADEITIEKIKKSKKVEFILNAVVNEIKGDKFITSATIENLKTKKKREIKIDGLFVEIGYIIDTSAIKGLVDINEKNEIVINEHCETSKEGIFAAGDLTTVPYKQAVISAGEGAKAGLSAYNYLQKKEGKPSVRSDWG